MWRKVLVGVLLAAAIIMRSKRKTETQGTAMSKHSQLSDRTLLEQIKDQLDRQEKTTSYLFEFNMGIGFIGMGVGVGLASLASDAVKFPGLSLVLIFAGALLIAWAGLRRSEDYHKNLAIGGSLLFIAGISIVAFGLPLVPPEGRFLGGASATLLGTLVLFLAARLPQNLMRSKRRLRKAGDNGVVIGQTRGSGISS